MAFQKKRDWTEEEARDLAYRYLGNRDYGQQELVRKMGQRGVEQELAEQLVDELAEQGLVDDARFAEVYVRYRFNSLFGPLKIRSELQSKGVDSSAIHSAMAEYDEQWGESLSLWLGKRVPSEWNQKEKARIYRSARNRGFVHDQIMGAIDRAQCEHE